MKLPLDFGIKLFFRLLLPGFFLTLGLLPIYFGLLDLLGLSGHREVAFVIAIIVTGWLIVAADMPIYMFLEGRRYWPTRVWTWMRKREAQRLKGVIKVIDSYFEPGVVRTHILKVRYNEAGVARRSFPLNEDGEPAAEWPTRLGNMIAAFEQYSYNRYGLEAIFYWPRIWINLTKDLRDEIDNQQAMADSAVYSTLALGLSGVAWILYGVLEVTLAWIGDLLVRSNMLNPPLTQGIFRFTPSFSGSLLTAGTFLLIALFVYKLAVFLNEQYGNVFMAVIDSHVTSVKQDYVQVAAIARYVSSLTGRQIPEEKALETARSYLQYYNASVPGLPRTVPIPKIRDTLAHPEGQGEAGKAGNAT